VREGIAFPLRVVEIPPMLIDAEGDLVAECQTIEGARELARCANNWEETRQVAERLISEEIDRASRRRGGNAT